VWEVPLTRWAAVFFIVFALASAAVGVSLASDAWIRGGWPTTDGVIVSVTEASVKDVDVAYRYRAGGREVDAHERRRRSGEMRPGHPVTVRYDPDRPERSTTRPAFAEWFSAGVAAATTAVTVVFAVLAFRAR
jgi:hypothetical protein